MIFGHFLSDVNEANLYVVACPETRHALLVDAAAWEPQIEHFLNVHRLKLTGVFITHDHYDHTGGLDTVMGMFNLHIHSGSGHAGGLAVHHVRHDDTIHFGHVEGRVIATPGHTPEGISLILPGMVFTGDALFSGSVGGTSSYQNAQIQLHAIRNHIFTLPDHFEIHPGHGPASTVGIERRFNPFFQ